MTDRDIFEAIDLTVSTDKLDYAPDEEVTITASGFEVDSTLRFEIADDPDEPGDDDQAEVYEPFSVRDGGSRDLDGVSNGQVVTTWFVPPAPLALNGRLNLTVTGNGTDYRFGSPDDQRAFTSFTDAFPLVPPVQTYYVPIPEPEMFTFFDIISSTLVEPPIRNLIGFAIAADNTIVYYDHWEDGYEADVTNPQQATTRILGDDEPSNGSLTTFGFADDIFEKGDALVLDNEVPLPRDPNDIFFDGRDRIQATFPISVTRAGLPMTPGAALSDATEVLDTDRWGLRFVAPVGENQASPTNAFQYTALFVMAGQDGTVVTLPNLTTQTLDQGESLVVRVNRGAVLTASDPVQVHLLTGDIDSQWESRWYSLLATDEWSNDYYTPVGTGTPGTPNPVPPGNPNGGLTGVWLYNPNPASITVTYQRRVGVSIISSPITVASGATVPIAAGVAGTVPVGSGARFFTAGGQDFFAFTQTDTITSGTTFDWGIPLLSSEQVTSQVIVGLGYGNATNDAMIPTRSPVWITPVADADIFVDFDGNGIVDQTFDNVPALSSIIISDPTDNDMTGAFIFATDTTGNINSPVNIAAAWGQNPLTYSGQANEAQALDLGTQVPPLPTIEAGKSSRLIDDADGDGEISPGDTLRYSITIVNTSLVNIPAGFFNVLDPLSPNVIYINNTTQLDSNGDGTPDVPIPDSGVTPFPLDETGFTNTVALAPNGRQIITFNVRIQDFGNLTPPGVDDVINAGVLRSPGTGQILDEFEDRNTLNFRTNLNINKVTRDDNTPANIGDGISVVVGSPITWVYEVTTTGNVFLANIIVNDNQPGVVPVFVSGDTNNNNLLEPSETWIYEASGTAVSGNYNNTGSVTGNPVYGDGVTPVPGLQPPTDSDPSSYTGVTPAVTIVKRAGSAPDGTVLVTSAG
ncbi:hypothetical protein, partial [Gloeocapsa sp. PCC 73106]|uniref:DUF7507 domain-containing protein n=1 Tax=Gloeocapsa sp. PCC 73106 TaxID=102232 RepID=UPI0002AC2DB4